MTDFLRSGGRSQAELAHQAEVVEAPPALGDTPVADPEDVDPWQGDGPARSGHAEDLALLRAAGREVLGHQVAFGDEEAEVAVPVGERGPEHGRGLPHAFPVGGAAHGRVVIDEILHEVLVNGTQIALGEQGLDEGGDGVLVLFGDVHDRSLRRRDEHGYPNNLGFAEPMSPADPFVIMFYEPCYLSHDHFRGWLRRGPG